MLNGFPPSWDPFFQGSFARRKLPKFDKLWADCSQEESRLMSNKQKVDDKENQALAVQVKKIKEREEGSPRKCKKHVIRGIFQMFNSSIAGRWDIMSHNVLTNMRRKIRRIKIHFH
jgi:hypothetical protein